MQVESMACSDCERHVADALREAGAHEPTANFRRGEAHFGPNNPRAAMVRGLPQWFEG